MRISHSIGAIAVVILAACGTPRARLVSAPPASAPPASEPRAASTYPAANVTALGGIPLNEITGTYTGDWGTMHLIFVGNEVRGAYSHENGRLVGTIDGDIIRATWCQDQAARSPTGSAEFRFTKQGELVSLDGRWTYADAPTDWHEDWDINHSAVEDAALAQSARVAACP